MSSVVRGDIDKNRAELYVLFGTWQRKWTNVGLAAPGVAGRGHTVASAGTGEPGLGACVASMADMNSVRSRRRLGGSPLLAHVADHGLRSAGTPTTP